MEISTEKWALLFCSDYSITSLTHSDGYWKMSIELICFGFYLVEYNKRCF
jgi:hypothetical protein